MSQVLSSIFSTATTQQAEFFPIRNLQSRAAVVHVAGVSKPGPDGGPKSNAPRRITDTSRVGLKQQLRMVKILKELASDGGQRSQRHAFRTAHRKKKHSADEREVYKAQQLKAMQEAQTTGDVTFKSLYGTDGLTSPPVLLVDGYNVIGTARRLNGLINVESSELDEYRDQLLRTLTDFSHYRGIKVILVYDALNGLHGNSNSRECTKQVSHHEVCRASSVPNELIFFCCCLLRGSM